MDGDEGLGAFRLVVVDDGGGFLMSTRLTRTDLWSGFLSAFNTEVEFVTLLVPEDLLGGFKSATGGLHVVADCFTRAEDFVGAVDGFREGVELETFCCGFTLDPAEFPALFLGFDGNGV
jgi:hypothetical protein